MMKQATKDGCLTVDVEDGVWLSEVADDAASPLVSRVFLGDSRAELLELAEMLKGAALELPEEET